MSFGLSPSGRRASYWSGPERNRRLDGTGCPPAREKRYGMPRSWAWAPPSPNHPRSRHDDTSPPSGERIARDASHHAARRHPWSWRRWFTASGAARSRCAGSTPQHCGHTDSLREQLIDAPHIGLRSCRMEGVERSRVARGVRPGATPSSEPVAHHVRGLNFARSVDGRQLRPAAEEQAWTGSRLLMRWNAPATTSTAWLTRPPQRSFASKATAPNRPTTSCSSTCSSGT